METGEGLKRNHSPSLGRRALLGEVPHLPTVVARPSAALLAIPRHVARPTAVITRTTTTSAAARALVAVPRHVPRLPAYVTRAPASASALPASIVKPIPAAAAPPAAAAVSLDGSAVGCRDIDGLGAAVVALGNRELDVLPVGEGAETVGLDGGLVDEEVLAAAVRRDEAEPLRPVEPLDLPLHPLSSPSFHLSSRANPNTE
ncbi:unnamed protein product, partial [Musa acuminata var. zebrina]